MASSSSSSSSPSPSPSPPPVNLFVVFTSTLTLRIQRLNGFVGALKKAVESTGRTLAIHTLAEPSAPTIERNAADYKTRVAPKTTNDPEFDRMVTPITPEVLSNSEKHRAAWLHIASAGPSAGPSLVVEDDTVLFPDHQKTLEEFVQFITGAGADTATSAAWDFIPLGMSPPVQADTANAPFAILPLPMKDSKILPCKEAYWISPRAAAHFLKETETIGFPRVQISYILYQQYLAAQSGAIVAGSESAPLRAGYPVRRVTVEGSKLGLYTSSLHPNNMLILNAEYMRMFEMVRKSEVDVKELKSLYKTVAHLRNPDLLHLYGVLLFKAGQAEEAETYLSEAVDEIQKQNGHLSARSDILNNAINIQEFLQRDVAEITTAPSKYEALYAA